MVQALMAWAAGMNHLPMSSQAVGGASQLSAAAQSVLTMLTALDGAPLCISYDAMLLNELMR
jgi:hypothetical protein